MSRRVIVKRDEMYQQRLKAWEFHYKNRSIAREMCLIGFDGGRVASILKAYCVRELRMDGWLLDVPFETRKRLERDTLSRCRLSSMQTDLLCDWYWTEQGWLEFVRLWQALPEVEEDYYHVYDPLPNDRLLLMPMSSKPKRGVVYNLGTSSAFEVQVPNKAELARRL